MKITNYKVPSTKNIKLTDYPTTENKKKENDEIRENILPDLVRKLQELHHKLHAEEKNGILVVLQAMDAAGKDEAISYIFSNLSAQGLKTTTLGKPSEEEKKHDYLWRIQEGLPSRGEIGILNRSHYEEVIAPRIHDLLEEGDIPEHSDKKKSGNYGTDKSMITKSIYMKMVSISSSSFSICLKMSRRIDCLSG